MSPRRNNNLAGWLVLALLIIGAIVVLRFVLSITAGIFWPVLLLGIGAALGLWWADRGRRR